jgi:hypothetical protein
MAVSFRWNFGPEGDIHDAAIRAWRADRKYLRQMARVLRNGCSLASETSITCPGRGGTDFRAGFQYSSDGWKMSYFLAGD